MITLWVPSSSRNLVATALHGCCYCCCYCTTTACLLAAGCPRPRKSTHRRWIIRPCDQAICQHPSPDGLPPQETVTRRWEMQHVGPWRAQDRDPSIALPGLFVLPSQGGERPRRDPPMIVPGLPAAMAGEGAGLWCDSGPTHDR